VVSETSIGLIGEYIAAACLLSLGYRVALAAQDRVDLVCWNDEHILRVQVKSATLQHRNGRQSGYQFQLGSGSKKKKLPSVKDYDLVVCVGIDQRRCIMFATEQLQQYTKRVTSKRFDNPQIEYQTMAKAVEIIKARR